VLPLNDSEEVRAYLEQKMQDRVLKFHTRLAPTQLLEILRKASPSEVSEWLPNAQSALNKLTGAECFPQNRQQRLREGEQAAGDPLEEEKKNCSRRESH